MKDWSVIISNAEGTWGPWQPNFDESVTGTAVEQKKTLRIVALAPPGEHARCAIFQNI